METSLCEEDKYVAKCEWWERNPDPDRRGMSLKMRDTRKDAHTHTTCVSARCAGHWTALPFFFARTHTHTHTHTHTYLSPSPLSPPQPHERSFMPMHGSKISNVARISSVSSTCAHRTSPPGGEEARPAAPHPWNWDLELMTKGRYKSLSLQLRASDKSAGTTAPS